MSISSRLSSISTGFRCELVVVVVSGACIALIANPEDPALTSHAIHPVWAIGLILAARYGIRGLVSIPALALSVLIAEWLAGGSGEATFARSARPGDLIVLISAVAVAAVGAAHERRKAHLAERLELAENRAGEAEAAVAHLSDAALVLRDRCDRSSTSLVFLADIAVRLDDPDLAAAGHAALELAMARTGAGAGFIQLVDGPSRLRTLTSRGKWSADSLRPPALFRDLTVLAALDRASVVAAHEVPDVRPEDSDLVAPLVARNGCVIGVLALRRVPYRTLAGAVREDLVQVARWAAGPLARTQHNAATEHTPGANHVTS